MPYKDKDKKRKHDREYHRQWRKTLAGRVYTSYERMKERIRDKKRPAYYGLELLPRAEFVEWAVSQPEFHHLHKEWREAGYPMRLVPSINRKDPDLGYVPGNLEWVTMAENCSQRRNPRSTSAAASGRDDVKPPGTFTWRKKS